MPDISNIFVVMDPTTDDQRALKRATRIATQLQAKVHAYLCIFERAERAEDVEVLQKAEMERRRAWLEDAVKPLRDQGLSVEIEVEWDRDWREALGPAANRAGADLIVKSSFTHSGARRYLLKTSDWRLLRTAGCPVLLTKRDDPNRTGKIIAAVNIAAADDAHQRLNDQILEYARSIIEQRGEGELHAVNAYSGSTHFVHPPDLAKRCGIKREHAHVADAAPESLIAEVAEDIGAEMVVIGTVARHGIAGTIIGNTAERVLDHLEVDVLTIVGGKT